MINEIGKAICCKYAGYFPWWQQLDTLKGLVAIKNIIHRRSINCIIDVGANHGQFATFVRKLGFKGQIISFEPVKSAFDVLRKTFRHDTNWCGAHLALGDINATTQINVTPSYSQWSSILTFIDDCHEIVVEDIDIKRLDYILPYILPNWNDYNILLKIDTQGYDLNVFKGSVGCLSRIVALRSEISMMPLYKGMPHYIESLMCYEEYGYELVELSVITRKRYSIQEMDCLMQKSG